MENRIDIKDQTPESAIYPVVALRGLVLFPNTRLQFDVGREKSILAVMDAMSQEHLIFLTAQKNIEEDEPDGDALYPIGVLAKVKQVLKQSKDGVVRLSVEGLQRGKIVSFVQKSPFLMAEILPLEEKEYKRTPNTEALIRHTKRLFEDYIRVSRAMPPDIIVNVIKEDNCGQLADYIAANINLDYTDKQPVLSELSPLKRITLLNDILLNETEILSIENEINEKTKERMDENQRDYYLREQMRVISSELGEDDSPLSEAEALREKVLKLKMPKEQETKLLAECDKLAKMPFGSHEGSVIANYIDLCVQLPWSVSGKENIDLSKAQKILDRDHYGLEKVKERIVETLAVRKLSPGYNKQIICLVGPPGVGKTSIARSIATAIGRKYVRVSLGGIHDESEIVGHRKTYVGAMPGRIINALKQVGVNNPLLLLDEIDKLGQDSFKGDPAASLLEVLDPEQNSAFYDHFVDMPFDLSKVLFITTANDASTIPAPLLDRMDVIYLSSYTHEEKYNIAVKHLIPKQLKEHGIKSSQLRFMSNAVREMIDSYTREAGVRTLERTIASVCRKVAKGIVSEEITGRYTVTVDKLETLLGPKKFKQDEKRSLDEVGVVNGLAWTSVGGETMEIEVAVMDGTGKLELTGSLGDVMKESARAAITFVRSHAENYGIEQDFYTKKDIHIHVPEGAVPKDGPSAGIAIATAVTSALSGRPVRHDIAMTGEISLRGRAMAIGGLKEKSMAAYRAGMSTVLIPQDNQSDLAEIDEAVKEKVTFIPIRYADEAIQVALIPKAEQCVVPAKERKSYGEVRI